MNEIPDLNHQQRPVFARFFLWFLRRRVLRVIFVVAGLLVTLITIFYAHANRRGERLLEGTKGELASKGEMLEWSAFVPSPVPDEQNILKAPKIVEWFSDDRTILAAPLDHPASNDFVRRLQNPDSTREMTNAAAAKKYLAWSDSFQQDFDAIEAGLKRPYARVAADYSKPLSMQFPNSATWGALVITLEQRAKCHLLVGQSDRAWQELTLLHDLRRMVECQGKFITPEGAWMVRGSTRHALAVVAKGMELHAWSDVQLVELENRMQDTDCIAQFTDALRCGRALLLSSAENGALLKAGSNRKERAMMMIVSLAPRGELYEKYSDQVRAWQKMIDVLNPPGGVIDPGTADEAFAWWKRAQEGLPSLLRDQTLVNEGQIACALERCRLARGEYPEKLDSLTPQFITKLPHDIITGDALKYRRTESGGFVLYSVGWNQTDDGGQISSNLRDGAGAKRGDWCWSDVAKQ